MLNRQFKHVTMIKNILQLLQLDEFYGQSELIEFAKGKYKLEQSRKGIRKQQKRASKWQ